MRLAFVLRLGDDTRPAEGAFEGWIEEVDTCTEMRFRTAEELLTFLGRRFDLVMNSGRRARVADPKLASAARKNLRKEENT